MGNSAAGLARTRAGWEAHTEARQETQVLAIDHVETLCACTRLDSAPGCQSPVDFEKTNH